MSPAASSPDLSDALRAEVAATQGAIAAVQAAVADLADDIERVRQVLRMELGEVAHDLTALASLLGKTLGQPFAAQAQEIVLKRQTGAPPVLPTLASLRKTNKRLR